MDTEFILPLRAAQTLALVLFVSTLPALAANWHVATSGADTPTCGASMANACLTIQYTLDNRARNYDVVIINPGTYAEALTLRKSIILNGVKPGRVIVNPQGTSTAVTVNSGVTAELEYMTLTGGAQGGDVFFPVGGINNNGALALFQVKVQGNSSQPNSSMYTPGIGGILNSGILNIYASTISGNYVSGGCDDVGGIRNLGTLFMDYSTLSNNSAGGAPSCSSGPGGIIGSTDGLFNLGNLTIDTTLISGNTIATNGGSFTITRSTLTGAGTALALFQPATLVNSTISGNSTAVSMVSGFYGYNGLISLFNSTVSNNGVGLSGTGNSFISLQNTILGGNGTDCGGSSLYGSYNIIQNDSGCTMLSPTDNLLGISPSLGPLRYNDGPTPTMMPLVGSPAINAGTPGGCTDENNHPLTTDQRVLPRPSGGACDIGAVEVQPNDPGRY